ncbi:MAG: putative bifunctional diguanylate cyclase/phosphodiesterase [Roseobacter sp.]
MHKDAPSKLTRLRDALASRMGVALSVAMLIATCAIAAAFVERSVQSVTENHRIFSDTQLRNGFVSMSDIQRVLLIAQEAAIYGTFTPEAKLNFIEATDILYVRRDSFSRALKADDILQSAEDALASLEEVFLIADDAILSDFANPTTVWSDLFLPAQNARQKLVLFLDDMGHMQKAILRQQSATVAKQRHVLLASLGGLTFVGIAALLLFQSEVRASRARAKAEKHVQFLAFYDQLTELPNRAQFQARLGELLDSDEPVGLALVDLDDFKAVNDTYGHAAGDAVLCHVGDLLDQTAQQFNGFAARFGGDEFAIVFRSKDMPAMMSACENLLQKARETLLFEGETLRFGFSIGLATKDQLSTQLAQTLDDLCRFTDFALYTSKTNGRGRLTIYDAKLEQRFLERRSMVDALPKAINNDELEIYLQPKVRISSGEVYGFEALVRWIRNGSVISPDEFINIAEESGVVLDVDRFVLQKSAEIMAQFNQANNSSYSVSVNLSALHFHSDRVVVWVSEALERSGLRPELLTLEITETVEMHDWGQAHEIISAIRAIGPRISIDDFGTGYSSLGYLQSATTDELKIDRSLVDQIEHSQKARFLLDGVLDMAQNLQLHVVVEGIETEQQAKALIELGAQCGQGYLYGRPVPAQQALEIAWQATAPDSQENNRLH